MEKGTLKFHKKRCNTCKYYKLWSVSSECLLLERTLSTNINSYIDKARYCSEWRARGGGDE